MGFDVEGFRNATFKARTVTIRDGLAGLEPWFGDDEPAWTVRGLTANELSRAETAARGGRKKLEEALSQKLSEGTESLAAVLLMLNVGNDLDFMTALRVEVLALGSVEPKIDPALAKTLSEAAPNPFRLLADEVLMLSGRGQEPTLQEKPMRSGTTPVSESASTPVTQEGAISTSTAETGSPKDV